MLNRTPSSNNNNNPPPNNVINSFRKRRMQRPILIYGAIGLILVGAIVLILWMTGGDSTAPLGGLFPSETPTPTLTYTPTNTVTPSLTATITETPTATLTSTPSGPVDYIIQEGDTLPAIAERFGLGDDGVLLLIDYNPVILENGGVYFVGQTLKIPPPGTVRATTTPIPPNLSKGTIIEYGVLPGDTLAGIAAKFNSTEEKIIEENKIENANALQVGQVLKIPVNLITPTPTLPPTSTPITPTIPGQPTATATPTSNGVTVTGTAVTVGECSFTESQSFVADLLNLINNERTSQGLTALKVNAQLTTAAQKHAADMICNDYLSHISFNGSSPQSRVQSAGYTASLVNEHLFALSPLNGGTPLAAFNWWMNDSTERGQLLDPTLTEIGIAYVSSDESMLGGYFVVVTAKP